MCTILYCHLIGHILGEGSREGGLEIKRTQILIILKHIYILLVILVCLYVVSHLRAIACKLCVHSNGTDSKFTAIKYNLTLSDRITLQPEKDDTD